MNLKLICPFKIKHDKGGAHHFLGVLLAELEKKGIEVIYTSSTDQDDGILLINSFLTPAKVVKKYWKKGLPVLLRMDGSAYAYGRIDNSDRLQADIAKYADCIVYQSKFSRDILHDYKITDRHGEIILNGVDTDFFTPVGEKSNLIKSDKPVILYCASSEIHLKGFRYFIHLACTLKEYSFYAVVPKGKSIFNIEEGGNLPDNLYFLGHLNHAELRKVLRSVDVFCSPSINDCAPNIVVQALASGLPVWHSGSGGIPEEVGDCGRVISDDLEADIEFLLENKKEISCKARTRAESHFSIKSSADRYYEVIRGLHEKSENGLFKRTFKQRLFNILKRPVNYFPRIKAGYFLNLDKMRTSQYHRVRASAWIRCFQMLDLLKWYGIDVVIDPVDLSEIDIAVIMDRPGEKTLTSVLKLKNAGIPIIFDFVTDSLDCCRTEVAEISETDVEFSLKVIENSDAVTAVSPWLADRLAEKHPHSSFIPDAVPFEWFSQKTTDPFADKEPVLCYAGMSSKASLLAEWWNIASEKGCRLITLTEKKCEFLPGAEFVPWRYDSFKDICSEVDIALCPRDEIDASYNKAHSSFKVDVFLAQSIPVIASPVPSYLSRFLNHECGFTVNSKSDFSEALDFYLSDREHLINHSKNCISAVREVSTRHVIRDWNNFIRSILVVLGKNP